MGAGLPLAHWEAEGLALPWSTNASAFPPSPDGARHLWPLPLASDDSEDPGEAEAEAVDPNEGRFRREFCDVAVVGRGQFSTVYSARSRTDQHVYAVKVQTRPPPGGDGQAPLREVFALARIAARASGEHLLRYFASWFEDNALHIQSELCEGSLRGILKERVDQMPGDPRFQEQDVVTLLRQVAKGLHQLHQLGLVHLDIKPDNILVSGASTSTEAVHYKIADFGLAIAADCRSRDDMTEGDCRYLAKELLQGALTNLPKADVLSLGLVCYEAATNPAALPCNGPEWQRLREGHLEVTRMPPLAEPLVALLVCMVRADPSERPSSKEVSEHQAIAPPRDEVQALREELGKARAEAERQRQLAETYRRQVLGGHQGEP